MNLLKVLLLAWCIFALSVTAISVVYVFIYVDKPIHIVLGLLAMIYVVLGITMILIGFKMSEEKGEKKKYYLPKT